LFCYNSLKFGYLVTKNFKRRCQSGQKEGQKEEEGCEEKSCKEKGKKEGQKEEEEGKKAL
jgi:hypothetical protein